MTALFAVVVLSAVTARADITIVYSSALLDVVVDNTIDYGNLGGFRLAISGKGGFQPSSFDGVMLDGVINGATGITGAGLFTPGYESYFLNDPADLMSVDPLLLPGYIPDPNALTGLFAISNPSEISPIWYLADITAAAAATVTLDFTIGEVGGNQTEYVFAAFSAPGAGSGMPGDADGDGDVDLDDFVILKNDFGGPAGSAADFDGDGDVDLDDFIILKTNFGAGSSAPLPEPGTAALVAAGCLLVRRRLARA